MAWKLSAALSGSFDLSDWTIILPTPSNGGSLSGTLTVEDILGRIGEGSSIVGHIQGLSDQLIRFHWDNGTLSFTKGQTQDSNLVKFTFKAADGSAPNLSFNDTFSYRITTEGTTLDVDIYADGKHYEAITPSSDLWKSDELSSKSAASIGAVAGGGTSTMQTSFHDLVPQSGTLSAASPAPQSAPALKAAATPQAAAGALTGTNKSVIYALQDVKATDLTGLKYQIAVVDLDAGFSKTQIAQMGGGTADKRQLMAYMSIGEAEDYRDYWQAAWSKNPPSWLGQENPDWEGNYYVKFWDPTWKSFTKARLKQAVDAGYDGAFFDVVDVYERAWVANGRANAQKDMIAFVKELSAYAKSLNPNFKIQVNNAEPLLADKSYLAAIDGVLKESLYYTGNTKNSASDTAWSTKYLDMAKAAGKNVSVIDYISDPTKIADMRAKATADGYGYYTSNRELKGVSKTGFSTFSQPDTGLEKTSGKILGTSGANKLTGTSGVDQIDGKSGDDMLWGKGGADVLTGGTGKDSFIFDTKLGSKNVDVIVDFNVKDDTIRLNNAVFTKLKDGKLSASSFVAGTKALDSNDRIVYNAKTGALSYDADGSGSTAAVKFAVIDNHVKLTAADFIII